MHKTRERSGANLAYSAHIPDDVLQRELTEDFVPPLEDISLKTLKALYVHGPMTLYKVSKLLDISFSQAYKYGKRLQQLRLITEVGKGVYAVSAKGCIALYANNILNAASLYNCLSPMWPLKSLGIDVNQLLSFIYVLTRIVKRRKLNLVNATICYFEEAALHVFKFCTDVVYRLGIKNGYKNVVPFISKMLGLNQRVVVDGFRVAFKGISALIPPTIKTDHHYVYAIIIDNTLVPISVLCKNPNCSLYYESLGLACPILRAELREIIENIHEKKMQSIAEAELP